MLNYAVLGKSVENSLSPLIYGLLAEYFGIAMNYEALSLATSEELLSVVKSSHYDGLNITMPYKKAVLSAVSEQTDEVSILASANTLVKTGDFYKAYSTDGEGFIDSLCYNGYGIKSKSAYIYGLGGASRSIANTLAKEGISRLYYESRSLESEIEFAESLSMIIQKKDLNTELISARDLPSIECEIAINASSLGTAIADGLSIDLSRIKPELCYDIVYVRVTQLMKEAANKGIAAISGIDMLIAQAQRAFQHFFPEVDAAYSQVFFDIKKKMGV